MIKTISVLFIQTVLTVSRKILMVWWYDDLKMTLVRLPAMISAAYSNLHPINDRYF